MSKQYNNSIQGASERIQWERDDVASKIVDFEQARQKQSQRQYLFKLKWPFSFCRFIILYSAKNFQ